MSSNRSSTMPTRENGESLAERLIPQALTNAAATFVDSVKLSSVSERVRRGRRVVLKRRNAYSEQFPTSAICIFAFRAYRFVFGAKSKTGGVGKQSAFKCSTAIDFASSHLARKQSVSISCRVRPYGNT